jgi:adenylate cyclase
MTNASVQITDWGALHRQSLTAEILRSGRRRATILACLFLFAACVYTFFAFTPGLFPPEFHARFRAQWPWMFTLYMAVTAYELGLRAGIDWLIAHRREPNDLHRFLNALIEISIPTVMMFMAVTLIGPRDALGSPAFLLYFFFILLSILQLDPRLCLFTGLVAALQNFLFAHFVIQRLADEAGSTISRTLPYHLSRSLILFVAGVVAALIAREILRQVERSLRTVQERDQAIRIFGQHVSPQIADKLLRQPMENIGELRHVCVMFLDIRNFSNFAAGARPEAVMAYLNVLFDFMIDTVNEHHGIVNKFLGDGFMAVFGAPVDDADQCVHAVDASLEILARLDRLNAAGEIHPTRVGIGLHTGEAVTGNVGSNQRKEYTIIGDVVNMASRIEQATKDYSARLRISDAVRQNLDGRLAVEDLGETTFKGQTHPARIFKIA